MEQHRPHSLRVSHDKIQEIWDSCGLGTVRSLAPLAGGVRNESYTVNHNLVLRFNTRDPKFAKFRNERTAYDLLAPSPLPVPTVVALDESRKIVPYDFIIVTRLPGRSVAQSRRQLDGIQVHNLAHEAGRCLALLHEFTFGTFGKLRALQDRPFASWCDYFADYAQRYMSAAQKHELIDDTIRYRLEEILLQAHDLLAAVTPGVFVHSDFHYENMLQEQGRLTGLLDFEWAISGDASADFTNADTREEMIPGSETAFLEGYLALRPLNQGHRSRVDLYRLFLRLETAVMYQEQGDKRDAHIALASMLDALKNLGSSSM